MSVRYNCPEYVDELGERPCDNPNEDMDCRDCQYGEDSE